MKEYWNNGYWAEHLNEPESNDLFDVMWIKRHEAFLCSRTGRALDLGCGIGQNTDYLASLGYEVTSADISRVALDELTKRTPCANVVELDMSYPLPFGDKSFDLVFAGLSVHYFDQKTTQQIFAEVARILTPNGLFVGAVNSTLAYKYIADHAVHIEDNYYVDGARCVRLFDREQLINLSKGFEIELLELTHTQRFGEPKDMWEFIFRKLG